MSKKHVAVVMGGYSSEFEISLESGSVVCELLDPNKYFIYPVHILKEGWNFIDSLGEKYPINKADFKLIQDDLETIKHIGGVQSVQMTEEEIAAADSASLSGGSISSSTLSALGGNTKPDPDASKKLQKQIDSYDDKSIVVKSGNKKPTDALSDYLTKAGTQGEQINSKLLESFNKSINGGLGSLI